MSTLLIIKQWTHKINPMKLGVLRSDFMKLFLFFLMFSFFGLNDAFAVNVENFYQAYIPVATQSSKERNLILPEALSQVLVKVSGSSQVLDNAMIKSQLNNAMMIMQEFEYQPINNKSNPYLLAVQFDADGVNNILRDAAVPIWGANRPLILAWVEYDGSDERGEIIDNGSSNEIHSLLKTKALQRGVPIIFPLMDVADLNQVTAHDIASMNISLLKKTSERYSSDALLIMHIKRKLNSYSVTANLVLGENQWDATTEEKTIVDVINSSMNSIADRLAEHFATVVTNKVQTKLLLEVIGISEKDDFGHLIRYLEHLPPVASLQIERISGDHVILDISLRSSPASLQHLLSLGNKLKEQSTGVNPWLYQWSH